MNVIGLLSLQVVTMLILNSGVKCFMSVLVKIRPRSFVLMVPYSLKYVANFIVKYSNLIVMMCLYFYQGQVCLWLVVQCGLSIISGKMVYESVKGGPNFSLTIGFSLIKPLIQRPSKIGLFWIGRRSIRCSWRCWWSWCWSVPSSRIWTRRMHRSCKHLLEPWSTGYWLPK